MDIGHIVIGGCGHLGRRIAEELCARGYAVVMVERQAGVEAHGGAYRMITGDICDDTVLHDAGIAQAHCLLVVTGDDRTNLEAAITARHLVPQLRTVVRLFDQSLAQNIERAFGVQVLSSSFLALPAYLAAATADAMMAAFEIDGCQLNLSRRRDLCLGTGVPICLAGTHLSHSDDTPAANASLLYATVSTLGHPVAARHRRRGGGARAACRSYLAACSPHAVARNVRALWGNAELITRRLLLMLLVVVILSVVIFTTVGQLSVLDALYFVVTTLTTVGYGDINLLTAAPVLKAYGIVMMLCGATLLATVYAIISDIVLTARIEYLLGRRAVALSNHIIIVGLGRVGYRVARTLHALGYATVAVEAKEDSDEVSAVRLEMPVIIGNAARASVLQKAGVARASTILALTDNPLLNLSVVLQARKKHPEIRTVVRTYECHFAEKLQLFNLDAIISTTAISAPVFTNAAIYPDIEGSLLVDGQEVLVVRHQVTATSPLCGMTVQAIGAQYGIAVVLEARPASPYQLAGTDTVLADGHVAILLLTPDHMERLTAVSVG